MGDALALPGREERADERGVMLPLAKTSLTGVGVCLTRGPGGSDRTLDPATAFTETAAFGAATRGATGTRAVRFEDREGLSGGRVGLVVRSEDIEPVYCVIGAA